MNCQNGFCVGFYPRNLNHSIFWTCACGCVSACEWIWFFVYVMNGWDVSMFWIRFSVCKRKNALEKKQEPNISAWKYRFRSVDTFSLLNTFAYVSGNRQHLSLSCLTLFAHFIGCKNWNEHARASNKIHFIFMKFRAFSDRLCKYIQLSPDKKIFIYFYDWLVKYELHLEETQTQIQWTGVIETDREGQVRESTVLDYDLRIWIVYRCWCAYLC